MKIIIIGLILNISFSGLSKASLSKLEISEKDSTKFNSLMIGSDYSSNTSSYGRFSSLAKQPSFSGFASFYSKFGLNFGLSSLSVGNSDSSATDFTYEYDFNLGYDLNLGKYFTVTASYSHFFYSKNSYSLKSLYNDEFSLGVNLTKGKLFANISGYYLLGGYNEWMNSAHVGLNFEIKNIFGMNHSISLSPEISVMMANQRYYNQYAYRTYWYLYRTAKQYPDLTVRELFDSPGKYPVRWGTIRNSPKLLRSINELNKDLVISDLFKAKNEYNFSSVSFVLPVYYNIGNLSLNVSYSVSFSLNIPEYLDHSTVSFISAGAFYSFIL